MNAFYRFIIGLTVWLLGLAALISWCTGMLFDAGVCGAAAAVLVIVWEWMAREGDRREQMRTYRDSVWERRIR